MLDGTAPLEQFAFVFDTHRLENGPLSLYSVDDPQDLIAREPLVGWFRTKGFQLAMRSPSRSSMFAYDPQFADQERQLLANLATAVQNDGRGEDDWIMLGSAIRRGRCRAFPDGPSRSEIGSHRRAHQRRRYLHARRDPFFGTSHSRIQWQSWRYDFFSATVQLSLEQALEVSDHLPIWPSSLQSKVPNPVALLPSPTTFTRNSE